MRIKTNFLCVFALALSFASSAQKIVVDTASTNKYIIKREVASEAPAQSTKPVDPTFGDRALSIGKGILNRLKARLNLEEASESLKAKKQKLLGKKEEEPVKEEPPKADKESGN